MEMWREKDTCATIQILLSHPKVKLQNHILQHEADAVLWIIHSSVITFRLLSYLNAVYKMASRCRNRTGRTPEHLQYKDEII